MLSAWRALARNPGLVHTTPIFLPFRPYHLFRRQPPKFDIFKSDPTRIRKSIDAILQYRGKKQKLLVRPDGYMRATDVLRSLNWHNTTLEDFQRYARTKTRGVYEFALEPDVFNATEKDRKLLWIRRTAHLQRQLSDLVQFRILDHKHLPMAIYKAPRKEWPELKTKGIRPGTCQTLVKLSPLEYVEENTDPVETSFVYINLDVEKALKGGVDFYKTRRRHIVTPGDSTGVIKPEYYKDVTFVSVDQEFLT